MLEFAILGLLHDRPMHGYELRKELSTVCGGLRAFSYGSLYPALRRMKESGLIAVDDTVAASRLLPADASAFTGKRGKVVYKLTAEGKERFADWVAETGPDAYDDERFGVHLAFFSYTACDVRLRILEGRRRRVEEQQEGLTTALARTRERLDRYTLVLHQHGLDSVNREVRWLSELIDTERADQAGDPTPGRPNEPR
ncbi:MAG: PadR family transcriptional regulator [Geodermatophilaceae bacterium]|jgi:DNA-binding PadR family transcriptional regulator|nr:PadR family transcriptional regulator [Geodermatophilaceae bacterium]